MMAIRSIGFVSERAKEQGRRLLFGLACEPEPKNQEAAAVSQLRLTSGSTFALALACANLNHLLRVNKRLANSVSREI